MPNKNPSVEKKSCRSLLLLRFRAFALIFHQKKHLLFASSTRHKQETTTGTSLHFFYKHTGTEKQASSSTLL